MLKVAVIGAGPAGSIAALILARAQFDVTLIEQHVFPRDKVCGECLSALGIDILSRLRLSAHSLNPIKLHRSILFAGNGKKVELPLPRPMWGISRSAFDQFLLDAAQSAGAKIMQPYRCENFSPLRIRDLQSNKISALNSDFVILANGKAPLATSDFGLKAHFLNVAAPRDAIELFGVRGHYGGIAPIEKDRYNIAFSVPEARIKTHAGDLDGLFAEIISENQSLEEQMRSATRVSNWLVSPLPRFAVMEKWPAGVIPVGNAAAALEPIGGEGMGLAMRSAELAANNLIKGYDEDRLRSDYRKLWRMRRFACRAAAMLVSNPTLSRTIAPLEPLAGLALRAIGKS